MKRKQYLVNGLLVLTLALCVLFATSQDARADRTQTMKYVKSMGDEYVSGVGNCNKILIQSYSTGKKWFVWYYYKLGIYEGDNILITFDDDGYWKTISNLSSGNWQKIEKVLEVN